MDIRDETAVKSVGQQEDTKVTFPTAEISKEIGSGIETMESGSKTNKAGKPRTRTFKG